LKRLPTGVSISSKATEPTTRIDFFKTISLFYYQLTTEAKNTLALLQYGLVGWK
jgi:hypothetical protein